MIDRNGARPSGWAVLYRRRDAPSLTEIETAIADGPVGGTEMIVSTQPITSFGNTAEALECVVSGLSFDLVPIAHNDPACEIEHGFDVDVATLPLRSGLTIEPSPHIGSAARTLPIIRAGAAIAARLSRVGNPAAVVWRPLGSAMEPGYFRETIGAWLDGGVFPALGLTTFGKAPDGGLHSSGLAFFTGQEVRIAPDLAARGPEALKIGARVIDRLVEADPFDGESVLALETGERVRLSVSRNRRFVIVSAEA